MSHCKAPQKGRPFTCLDYGDAIKGITDKSPAGRLALKHYNEHKVELPKREQYLLGGERSWNKTGAIIGTGASIAKSWDKITNGGNNNFCLNAGQERDNVLMSAGKNSLNVLGGLGDLAFGAAGDYGKSPLDKMQEEVTQLNQEYEATFKQFVQTSAANMNEFNEHVIGTFKDIFAYSTKNSAFLFEVVSEKEQIDRIYIIFLFVYIVIILIYILSD